MTNNITITVSGPAGSGKTAIQQWIAEQLSHKFNQVEIDWGIDGNPNRELDSIEDCLTAIADKTQIKILTQQIKR